MVILLIGLYLDNVLPGEGGIKKPWYYFVTRNYWCPHSGAERENQMDAIEDNKVQQLLTPEEHEVLFEEVSHDLKSQRNSGDCFSIHGMTKRFEDGKVAVRDFTLEIYRGQVFILLGHNGAGKTTALSMLAGFLSPTSGQAFIKGINVFREKLKLKEMLGICPQECMVYDLLTVEEHLNIFCSFKDVNFDFQREDLIAKMRSLGFLDCFNKQVKQLAGGQRRKLSVLLALIGNPAVVMLDEPTAGLDVDTRRKIWKVIRETKQDHVVLMTTHYMDEAETLGDRIAIMADGEIKCCGSSLFLKKQFKTGYHLTMVKTSNFNQERAGEFIRKHIHDFFINQNTVSEMIYNIPFEASAQFPQMFEELDDTMDKIGISSYGIAITSLEDVFLKVGEERHKLERAEVGNGFSISTSAERSFFKNVRAVAVKIWLQALRHPRVIILEILLPLLLFGFSLFGTAFITTTEYLYKVDSVPARLPVVMNKALPNSTLPNSSQSFEALKANIPYELLSLDTDITLPTAFHRAKDLYSKEAAVFGDTAHFGAYYIENVTRDNFTAMVIGDPRWALMPTYLCALLTNAYLKAYRPEVTITQRVAAMSVHDTEFIQENYLLHVVTFVILTGIAFSIPIASIAYFLVQERKTQQKFMEMFHGLNMYEYWVGRFVADCVKLFIPFLIIIIVKLIVGLKVVLSVRGSCPTMRL